PGVTGFTRTRESPNLVAVHSGTVPAGAALLARVPVDPANGQVNGTINNGVRRLIGAVVADRSITEPKLADNAVSSRTIAAGAVTEPKLVNDAVSNRTIQTNAVGEPELGNNAVSTRTIQNNAVTEPKLANDAVSNRTIQTNAVTAPKLQSDAANDANR